MTLYILGGLGPAVGPYAAVLMTSAQASLGEYHGRLLRWRLSGWWYLIAFGLPIDIAVASTSLAILLDPSLTGILLVKPWYMLPPLFASTASGGGMEELGWRGVAQPEIARAIGPAWAALLVGLIWATWHLPLFLIPGVFQYHGNFLSFAVSVVGAALMLGWLYTHTQSILLCILFHATGNAIVLLALAVPSKHGWLAVLSHCINILVGGSLLIADSKRHRNLTGLNLGRSASRSEAAHSGDSVDHPPRTAL